MQVSFYKICLEKLKERDYIKLEWIRETIETPDFKEEFSPWEVHFIKSISGYGNRFLRVVVNPQTKKIITYFLIGG